MHIANLKTGAKKGTSHNKLYAETQWPELEERRAYFKLCFMHKVVHKERKEDKDIFIGPKEFVSHMMMTQTKDRLYHQLK